MDSLWHFSAHELIRTNTGLDNFPDDLTIWYNLFNTAKKLEVIRAYYDCPIVLDCAYRSPKVNAKVGGVATSAHLRGLAADIHAVANDNTYNHKLYAVIDRIATQIDVDQLIMYNTTAVDSNTPIRFLHVGFCETYKKPRNQRLFK